MSPPPTPAPAPPAPPLEVANVWAGTMQYRQEPHNVLCRITRNNDFPNQLVCILLLRTTVAGGLIGTYGTVSIVPPSTWSATGTVYDFSGTTQPFTLTGGEVTSTSLTLRFDIGGSTYTFTGTPAQQPTLNVLTGVYTTADMRGPISFSVQANGDVFAQGGGCTMSGATYGLTWWGYRLAVNLQNCGPPPGAYEGFGILTQSLLIPGSGAESTMFAFVVANSSGRWIGGHALR